MMLSRATYSHSRANVTAGRARSSSRPSRRRAVVVAAKDDSSNEYTPENASDKPVAVITGASSGLGLWTAKALIDEGYFVVMAVPMAPRTRKASELNFDQSSFAVMRCELGDLESVREFAASFQRSAYVKKFQSLVCNAAVYLPNATVPSYTKDGFEECVGVNHLGHHLLSLLLLDDLAKAPDANMKRLIIVGSVTETRTRSPVKCPAAGLGDMSGLKNAFKNSDRNQGAMIDGSRFIGAKAYKDAKLCNMLDIKAFAEKYGRIHGHQV